MVLYVTVPIFLPLPSSLKDIAMLNVILSVTAVSDDAAFAADAKSTDDRFRLEAGRTARSQSTDMKPTQSFGLANNAFPPSLPRGERSQNVG